MTSAVPQTAPTLIPRPPGLIASPHKSDIAVPFRDSSLINICGVFHAYDPITDQPNKYLWLEDVRLWSAACNKYRAAGYSVFQFTEFSSPDKWFLTYPNMDIEANLSTSDFDIPHADSNQQQTNVTQDSERTGDATTDDERQREIDRLRAELDELSRQQQEANQRTHNQAQNNPTAEPEAIAFINFLNQNAQLMQQQ
eukprot:scaffold22584_cov21-Cyclotella_meneghiniana.AAC.1